MMADFVRLRHRVTGGEWDCPARAVDAWREKGWEPVEKTTTTTSARRRGDRQEMSNG